MDSGLIEENECAPTIPSTPSTPVQRTGDMVHSSAQAAGLTHNQGPVQVLRFSPSLNTDELTLLELPVQVLESLNTGDRYYTVDLVIIICCHFIFAMFAVYTRPRKLIY